MKKMRQNDDKSLVSAGIMLYNRPYQRQGGIIPALKEKTGPLEGRNRGNFL